MQSIGLVRADVLEDLINSNKPRPLVNGAVTDDTADRKVAKSMTAICAGLG
jgi:hypothetical protein